MAMQKPTTINEVALQRSAEGLSRFPTIDVLRGFAIFSNVLVHIFSDVFDLSPVTSTLFDQPISILVILIMIGYFGSFGSLFIMISGTGNMLSMQKSVERGKPVQQVIAKQIIGGIILLVFSFLVEGFFQFYGFLGTIGGINSHEFDPSRIVWHAYSMTPVHCLAFGMIFTGIVQGFMSIGGGFQRHLRNVITYLVLAVVVVALTQPVWDLCKAIGPLGFPNAAIDPLYPGTQAGDWRVYMPPPGANALDYIKFFFLMMAGGSNHPVFPFLAMTFVGNAIGIILVMEAKKEHPNPHIPKHGMLSAIFVVVAGVVLILVLGVDFSSILPVNSVGDITGIHGASEGFWIPWFTFLMAGEILLVFMMLRLVEYRGLGKSVGDKSKFLRRFGIPAFSTYAWHRFWSIPAILLISWIAGVPSWPGGSITDTNLNWAWTLVVLVASIASCTAILMAWEKIGYIGGIEWMIAEVATPFGKVMDKAKSTRGEKLRWWEHGKMDVERLFRHPVWTDVIKRDEAYHAQKSESILSVKLAILGLFVGIFAPLALHIAYKSKRTEGENPKNKTGMIVAIIGTCLLVSWIVLTSVITLPMLGISF